MEPETKIGHELIQECLERISAGDAEASFELSQLFLARIDESDVDVLLWIVEALARQSAALGSSDAKEFLVSHWELMKQPLRRSLSRTLKR